MFSKKFILVLCLCFVGILGRFYKLDWGYGNYFHPDENNMATAVTQLSFQNLNPHFFAYGQFPLYLARLSLYLANQVATFPNSIMALRFQSAIFSFLSLLIFFNLAKRLKINPYLFVSILIFTPGLIQLSHFGTTESLLILVFAANILISLHLLDHPTPRQLVVAAIVSGIGLATKISAIFFLGPILLALLVLSSRRKSVLFFLTTTIFVLSLTAIFFVMLSPYNWLSFANFRSTMIYETSVATGAIQVFYTRQFQNTIPYIFQLIHIFPYTNGLPVLVLAFLGFFHLIINLKLKIKNYSYWLIVLLPSLVYFIYQGQLYTKWTRFMSPLFFIFPLLASYLIGHLPKPTRNLVLSLCLFPGLIFFTIYLRPDNRLTFSQWMNNNLPAKSTILSEAGNVINLPLSANSFQTINFDFYGLDDSQDLSSKLPQHIFDSEFILVPSRRIFKNQSNSKFPTSNKYYQSLLSGQLGFQLLHQQSSFFLNDEPAEETWTVFDHPTIRLFRKDRPFKLSIYEAILKS